MFSKTTDHKAATNYTPAAMNVNQKITVQMSNFTSDSSQTNLCCLSISLHHTTHTLRRSCTFSLSLQTLTGADEPQSMIVMSYRSPWENRGTERGEGGRGNQRTHTQTEGGGLPEEKKKLQMN